MATIPLAERERAIKNALQVVVTKKCRLFGAVLEKSRFSGQDVTQLAFEQISSRFDQYLGRLHKQGDTQRGLILFDKCSVERRIQTMAREFKTTGHTFGRLRNLAEVPVFVNSEASRLIQLADLVAYALFRHHEFNDSVFYDVIRNSFDTDGGVIHGCIADRSEMTQDEAKALVGKRAAEFVEEGMAVGLGTGTTSVMFIHALGERVRAGLRIRCVASSDASRELGQSLGMNVTTLVELPELDVYIDGADEIATGLALIKGGGGALLREKIVASAAKKFIVVADSTKLVDNLGAFPLPVEVIQMALPLVQKRLDDLGLNPKLRHHKDGSLYLTDEGNVLLDCACGVIEEPEETAAEIRSIVGVVEHGLFLGMASLALIAGEDGVIEVLP